MIANLVKKDFLLVKKSIAAFLGISILVPLLVIILMRNTTQVQGIGMKGKKSARICLLF